MKITKAQLKDFTREMLATNSVWALRALIKIYTENQTEEEQSCDSTIADNGIGFSGVDANILSSFARQYMKYKRLSPKQMAIVYKKMPRYWRQVIEMSDDVKLVNAYLHHSGRIQEVIEAA